MIKNYFSRRRGKNISEFEGNFPRVKNRGTSAAIWGWGLLYREHTNRRVSLASPWLAVSQLTSEQTGIYVTTGECRTQPATSSLLLLGPSPHGWRHLIFPSNVFPKIPLCLHYSSLVLTLFWLPAFLIWGKCVCSLGWLDSALAGPPGLTSKNLVKSQPRLAPRLFMPLSGQATVWIQIWKVWWKEKSLGFEVGEMQIQAAPWPFTSCVIWSRFFNLTEFHFPYSQNGENNSYS